MPSEWAIARAKQHLSRVWYGAFKETSRDNLPALLDDVRRETAREWAEAVRTFANEGTQKLIFERMGLEDGDGQ